MLTKTTRAALATIAIFAFSACTAQAKQAQFTAGALPASVSTSQVEKDVLKLGAFWEVKCNSMSLSGTLNSVSEGLEMTPAYTGCSAGSFPVTVRTTEGCVFTWKLETLGEAGTAAARTSGACGSGNVIEIDLFESAAKHASGTPFCTYGIPPQVAMSIQTHNRESAGVEHVEFTYSLTGIEAKVIKGTKALCGAAAGGTVTGSYTGAQTATATYEGKPTDLMVG